MALDTVWAAPGSTCRTSRMSTGGPTVHGIRYSLSSCRQAPGERLQVDPQYITLDTVWAAVGRYWRTSTGGPTIHGIRYSLGSSSRHLENVYRWAHIILHYIQSGQLSAGTWRTSTGGPTVHDTIVWAAPGCTCRTSRMSTGGPTVHGIIYSLGSSRGHLENVYRWAVRRMRLTSH